MSPRSWRVWGLVLGVLAGLSVIGFGYWVHGVAGYRLGSTWVVVGFTITAPRLLVAMGVLMIVGAIILYLSDVAGGIIVAGAVCIAMIWCYYHPDHRVANVKLYAASIVLGFLSAMCAGLSLKRRTDAVGLPAAGPAPGPAPEREPEAAQV